MGVRAIEGSRWYHSVSSALTPTLPPGPTDSVRLLRPTLILVLAGLAFSALATYRDWRADRSALLKEARELGLDERNPEAFRSVFFEDSSDESRLLLARMLIYDVLDDKNRSDEMTEAEQAARLHHLERSRQLAEEVLQRRPASWRALMFLGASTYLERSTSHDRRLVTEAAEWEEPLLQATQLAQGMAEPRRFLVSAYLEVWRNLSAEKRGQTLDLLRGLLQTDRNARERLLPAWLAVARSRDEAFEPIPDDPHAWTSVARHYVTVGRWNDARAAFQRRFDAIEAELSALLSEAEERLRLGDFYYGRSRLLQVVKTAPIDRRFAPYVDQALQQYPAGLHGLRDVQPLRDWLRWSLELSRHGRPPLERIVLGRLAAAAGELERPVAALAALEAGEVDRAEQIERMTDHLEQEAWTPYLLAKAAWHRERGELTQASSILSRVGRRGRNTAPYWLEANRLASARSDLPDLEETRQELEAHRAESWEASAWKYRGERLFAEILVGREAPGLELRISEVIRGGLLQVQWDGDTLGIFALERPRSLRLSLPVEPGLHLLELRTLAGRQPVPGGFQLLAQNLP